MTDSLTVMTTNEAAERLRERIDERIAKLNPGQGMARDRRHYTDWCRIHLQHVRDEAMEALAAAKAEGAREAVERIREHLSRKLQDDAYYDARDVAAILDEEAAR